MKLLGQYLNNPRSPFFVAEISCNHEGRMVEAMQLIRAAKDAGADAVKIQVYDQDSMTIYSNEPDFIIKNGLWKDKNLYDLYKSTSTPFKWAKFLFEYAKDVDIPIFASVFDVTGLEFLEGVNCQAYKIASFEINDTNLIKEVASTKKPMVLSTGMASITEIDRALTHITSDVALLHCVSCYPCELYATNLGKITSLKTHYEDIPIGFSDHTSGVTAAIYATMLGARIIEKHIMLEGSESADSKFSLTHKQFQGMIVECDKAYQTLLPPDPRIEEPSRQFRRSLYAVQDIATGEHFTTYNVRSIRPGYGLDPDLLPKVLTKWATKPIIHGTAIKEDMVAW